MSDPERDLAADRRAEARRWLAVAEADLRVMQLCLDALPPELGAAAYHCQQATEKLLKGLLVLAAVPFGKTHDLLRLGDLAKEYYPEIGPALATVGRFTVWGFAFRYPGIEDVIHPSPSELQAAAGAMMPLSAVLRSRAIVAEDDTESSGTTNEHPPK